MQWIGWLGVDRMVHTGNVLGVGLGMQSKHSVRSYMNREVCGTLEDETIAHFDQGLDLTKISRCPRFYQRDLRSHTHLVHVPPSVCHS